MRSTFSILPYINRNKVKANGTTAVLCRITIDGKSSTMATGIYCRPEDWNSRTGTIRTVRENNRLQEFRKSIGLAYDEILKKQNVVSAELLKNILAKRAVIPTKLLQMGERERGLTGNDLETSGLLYSAMFCINQKNAFLIYKNNVFLPYNQSYSSEK